MKKTILILIIVLCGSSLFSQVSIGFAIGDNFCKVKRTIDYESNLALIKPDKEEFLITNGFVIGVPVEIGLTNRMSIFTSLSYIQKGSKAKYEYATEYSVSKVNGTTKYNYLEIPVQAKYCFVKNSMNIYVSFGPSIGYMISGRGKYKFSTYDIELNTTTNDDYDEKIKSKDLKGAGINRLDISLALGAGIDYNVGVGKIFFNLNYLHGLTDMINDDQEMNKGLKTNNRGITATIGYLIPLSKQK